MFRSLRTVLLVTLVTFHIMHKKWFLEQSFQVEDIKAKEAEAEETKKKELQLQEEQKKIASVLEEETELIECECAVLKVVNSNTFI